MTEPDADGFERLARLQAAAGHVPEVAWFLRQIDRCVKDGGARLERYLGLPTTPARRRRYLRDRWLARAAAEVKAPGIWSGALALAAEMERFVWRGSFARWLHVGGPPEGASSLESAIFHALALNDGRCLGPDRLVQIEIVSSAFIEKIDDTSPTIHASEPFEDTDADRS